VPEVSSEVAWSERVYALKADHARAVALLDVLEPMLAERLGRLLADAKSQLDTLQGAGIDWPGLARVAEHCREVFGVQLELLGGLAISQGPALDKHGFDGGFTATAQQWLGDLRRSLCVGEECLVIVGRGPLFDRRLGVIRAPFLGWDAWEYPLLARAIGLIVADELDQPGAELAATVDQLVPMLPPIIGRRDGDAARKYLHHLFADMFTTAVLGPVYPMAAFALTLDYADPERLGVENPDQIERRDQADHFLPSAVQRAAAMLVVLERMDGDLGPGVFGPAIRLLTAAWKNASDDSSGRLDHARQQFAGWHALLYERVCSVASAERLDQTITLWRHVSDWCADWRENGVRENLPLPSLPARLTPLLSAIWLHRFNQPHLAQRLLELAAEYIGAQPPERVRDVPNTNVLLGARLDRLTRRDMRLRAQLNDPVSMGPAEIKAVVAGRFYRLLSEQFYFLEQAAAAANQNSLPDLRQWITALEDHARRLQREALEVLGGVLIRRHPRGIDREPARLTQVPSPPRVCELADRMLLAYSDRTGVNWSGWTLLGTAPYLALETEVIRVPFPDWSLWHLPFLAHEFGHLVARGTPQLRQYASQESARLCAPLENEAATELASTIPQHLEEFFADIFGTFTLGPAYVCAAVLAQFDPANPSQLRGDHPPHDDRVRAILRALALMDERAARLKFASHPYREAVRLLQRTWTQNMSPNGARNYFGPTLEWADKLYQFVDSSYRLTGYASERWEWASSTGRDVTRWWPSLGDLRNSAYAAGIGAPSLEDLLNVLWWARASTNQSISSLTTLSLELGKAYLEEA
jgi:hypothetical protein